MDTKFVSETFPSPVFASDLHTISEERSSIDKPSHPGLPETRSDPLPGETKSELSRSSPDGKPAKFRRTHKTKRRTMSCETCKRLKTRCDLDPSSRKCHRCAMLRLACSHEHNLPAPAEPQETSAAPLKPEDAETSRMQFESMACDRLNQMSDRISALETSLYTVQQQLGTVLSALQQLGASTGSGRPNPTHSPGATESGSAVYGGRSAGSTPNPSEATKRRYSMLSTDSAADLKRKRSSVSLAVLPKSSSSLSLALNPESDDEKLADFLFIESGKFLDLHTEKSPVMVIRKLQNNLFRTKGTYDALAMSCDSFIEWFNENKTLALNLMKSFLDISHVWIIPGGITEIDEEYVHQHRFISCVFVLLAMCFDENYKYVEEQKYLYWMTRQILGCAVITAPLTNHDIEAILYLSMYDCSRKPLQQYIDNWILSGIGIKHLMISFNFMDIYRSVSLHKTYDPNDLFILRVWNSMCACHLSYCMGMGRPVMISDDYLEICKLTAEFPDATTGDTIKLAELDFYTTFLKIVETDDEHINQLLKSNSHRAATHTTSPFLQYARLLQWRDKWAHIFPEDRSNVLMFAYDFGHTMLSRRLIRLMDSVQKKEPAYSDASSARGRYFSRKLRDAVDTACYYSFSLIQRLLHTPPSSIRGTPNFQLCQITYSALTLWEYLDSLSEKNKDASLNLIIRTYWHLNYIGEKNNDATDTVGRIIKSLLDKLSSRHYPVPPLPSSFDQPFAWDRGFPPEGPPQSQPPQPHPQPQSSQPHPQPQPQPPQPPQIPSQPRVFSEPIPAQIANQEQFAHAHVHHRVSGVPGVLPGMEAGPNGAFQYVKSPVGQSGSPNVPPGGPSGVLLGPWPDGAVPLVQPVNEVEQFTQDLSFIDLPDPAEFDTFEDFFAGMFALNEKREA